MSILSSCIDVNTVILDLYWNRYDNVDKALNYFLMIGRQHEQTMEVNCGKYLFINLLFIK